LKQTILTLMKFGSEKNILDLYSNGTLYFNPIQFFRKYEDGQVRGDAYEGASEVKNSLPGSFYIPSINHTVNYQKIHIKQAHEEVLGNIYCLYCIGSETVPDPLQFVMDQRILSFGTHCLFVKDNPAFLDRIEKELQKQGYKFSHGLVRYYDKDKINSRLTVFEKPQEFEYQKEYRIYVQNDKIEPIKINIGSLRDIAEVHGTGDVAQLRLVRNEDLSKA